MTIGIENSPPFFFSQYEYYFFVSLCLSMIMLDMCENFNPVDDRHAPTLGERLI